MIWPPTGFKHLAVSTVSLYLRDRVVLLSKFNHNPRWKIILPWVVGNFVIDDLFRYSYNTSHGEVPFLVYNILDVAWSPWSPGREQNVNNQQGHQSSKKEEEARSMSTTSRFSFPAFTFLIYM